MKEKASSSPEERKPKTAIEIHESTRNRIAIQSESNTINDTSSVESNLNDLFERYDERLSLLPPKLLSSIEYSINDFIIASASQYDKDAEIGLDQEELEIFANEIVKKVERIIAKYAPKSEDAEELEADQKQSLETAEKSLDILEGIDIEGQPLGIERYDSPETLKMGLKKYKKRSDLYRENAAGAMDAVTEFKQAFSSFKESTDKWGVIFRGFAFVDAKTEDMRALQKKLKAQLKRKRKELAEEQYLLSVFGRELNNGSDKVKRNRLENRDESVAELDKHDDGISEKKESNKKAYQELTLRKLEIESAQEQLSGYKERLLAQREETEEAEGHLTMQRGELAAAGVLISQGVDRCNLALEGNLDPQTRKRIEEARDQLLSHSVTISSGLAIVITAADTAHDTSEQTEQQIDMAEDTGESLHDFLGGFVDPSLTALKSSSQALQEAALSQLSERDRIVEEYAMQTEELDDLDSIIAESVVDNDIGTSQLFQQFDAQKKYVDSLTIRRPNPYNATIGILFSKIGEGWRLLTVDAICPLLDNSAEWTNNLTKDIPVLNVLTEVATNITLGLPSGLLEGAGELVDGVGTMVAHPIQTLEGVGSLIGRDPETGNWSGKTAGIAWKELGKALIAHDEFSEGRIGKGSGKVVLNILTTITGAGAATNGVKGASLAYSASKAAGVGVAKSSLKAGATGASIFATEFTAGLAAIPGNTFSGVSNMIHSLPSSLSRGGTFSLTNIQRTVASLTDNFDNLSQVLDEMTIGGVPVNEMQGLSRMTPDQLLDINGLALYNNGIDNAAAIREFLRYRDARIAQHATQTQLRAYTQLQSRIESLPETARSVMSLKGRKLRQFIDDFNQSGEVISRQASEPIVRILKRDGDRIIAVNEYGKLEVFSGIEQVGARLVMVDPYGVGTRAFLSTRQAAHLDEIAAAYNKFTPNPDDAYNVLAQNSDAVIGFDEAGKLKIARRREVIDYKEMPVNTLSQDDLAMIVKMYREAAGSATSYNNAAMSLEFMSFVRRARAKNPALSMDEALALFELDSVGVVNKYGGGNCFALSQHFLEELSAHGIEGVTIGQVGFNAMMYLDDKLWFNGIKHAENSHGSIAIKYIEAETGQVSYLHLEMGTGLTFEPTVYDDISRLRDSQYANPEYGIRNVDSSVMKNQLPLRNKLAIYADPKGSSVLSVNLLKQRIYIKGEAALYLEECGVKMPHFKTSLDGRGRSRAAFNLEEILNNPGAMTTVYIDGAPVVMSNLESARFFVEIMGSRFKQPGDFADNLMYLLEHLDEYYTNVTHPDASNVYFSRRAASNSAA